MNKGGYLGEFEQLVMLALLRLDDNAYGVTIRQEIEARTGRLVTIGAVYATLSRLEAKGWIKSRTGASEPRPGGRWKKFFSPTPAGLQALRVSRRLVALMADGLDLEGEL